ncbi:ATP-dependent endonuclease [Chryseobacterium shigense]|uniref:Putative ATP-dependent endonuclease of the OLD family n=1 Tax=Chryseobacterium shigense TaxID=297244 RepID=A0A1N7HZH1_9FLAO|nr:AAA family ATPase [Chryseobacterium shigense]PQA90888.1 ATP-dependent endonuclease [Chryseobacterium shigense]SIS30161.1 putative ATP-dependent endonuclease of the OLD family [Chryseobacterium shigense]
MAKLKKTEIEASLVSQDPTVPKPKLTKLIIKNYRCIGTTPVVIDLDEVVVLVGANNVGKSSILKAYELAMSQGSGKANLSIEDFPNNKVDLGHLPEIEIHTIVYDNAPGDQWIERLENGDSIVKEKFIWEKEGKPIRQGWDVELQEWSENVPWGAPNVANSRRPEPHKVDAFDSPEKQAEEIKKLLMQALNERVKNYKSNNEDNTEENDYQKLLNQVKDLQKRILEEAKDQIDEVNLELTNLISKVFPNYKIDFDAKAEDNLDNAINLFKTDAQLLMGPNDGYLSTIDRQGSGARRTLLWTAIKFISENNHKNKPEGAITRPHLLLIDEPELCLHPNAIREACNLLYELPQTGNWQVMITTHSPIFIDFSKDNTTIIKVEKTESGEIKGTTVFRPDKVDLDNDDKRNLKLLNLCDPYVAEFFFGGKVIVVEGDTEYTAFNYIKQQKPDLYNNINIIRARGKATIVSLIKILNHFGSNYSVLHDCDKPRITTKKGKDMANPAWGNNPNILHAINSKPASTSTRLLASLPNFEQAYFGTVAEEEKPYNALKKIEENPELFHIIETLLKALIDFESETPINCTEWSSIEDLLEKVNAI